MIYVTPDYYAQFRCIAGDCRHSCCIGWEIDIDPASQARYEACGGAFGQRLRANILRDGENACFALGEGERCPFLNAQNLCDIYIHMGEDALCQICTDHPRFRNFFTHRTETGLGLCCEAAAALILTKQSPVTWVETDDGAPTEEPDADEEAVLAARDELYALVQDRSRPLQERLDAVLGRCGMEPDDRTPAEWAEIYRSLERLDPAWDNVLDALADAPEQLFEVLPATLDTVGEQLAVYFLYRHFADGLDDGLCPERAAFAVHATRLLMGLMAHTAMEDGALSVPDAVELARMYSSEIEYDEENINTLLEQM
ncbi:MAG: flagellin lysine-N-methylase [Clostridia bacterium]|nr:flagellin lysine-N-methylase [Clostridia bacterium]